MKKVTIKIRGFTFHKEVENPAGDGTTTVSDFATQGQEVEVNDADYKFGESIGAFVTDKDESEGGDSDVVSIADASDDELDVWLEEEAPTVGDLLDLVGDDKESAQRVLDAEDRVTNGDPRKSLADGLNKVIEAD